MDTLASEGQAGCLPDDGDDDDEESRRRIDLLISIMLVYRSRV